MIVDSGYEEISIRHALLKGLSICSCVAGFNERFVDIYCRSKRDIDQYVYDLEEALVIFDLNNKMKRGEI